MSKGREYMLTVNDYRFHVYADFGKGLELAAWYHTRDRAEQEVRFLESKGHYAEVRENRR